MSPTWKERLVAAIVAFLLALLGGTSAVAVSSVGGCKAVPSEPPEPPKPEPTPDPVHAIGKVVMSGGHCSGTIVGPRTKDGRYKVVSAAHCFKSVGETARFIPRDGRPSFQLTVDAIDRRSDIAICSTPDVGEQPYIMVAESTPPVGTTILHAGFGVDKPANIERGQVLAGANQSGQVRYRLSVSPGDSGGGICTTEAGELLSPVCCTDRLAGVGNVWGGSPEQIRRMLAHPTEFIDVPPVPMPPAPEVMPPPKP